jgi:glycolate oxidase FAD binding subunit
MSIDRVVSDSRRFTAEGLDKFQVDGVRPKAVVVPETVEEVAEILKRAGEEGFAVTPWGGGTMMGLGGVQKKMDVVLLLQRLNTVVEYLPEDLVITAQAGVTLENLQAVVGKKNQFLPLDPPYSLIATLGGIVASNSFGPLRYLYGGVRDLMLGVRVANSDGSLTRVGGKVVKNVAGYDIKKLYVGSLGTLGVIVHTTFKLYPVPTFEGTFVSAFRSLEDLCKASREVLKTCHASIGIGPSAIEGFDPNSCRIFGGGDFDIPEHYVLALRVSSMAKQSMEKRILELTEIARKCQSMATLSMDGDKHEALWKRIREYPGLSSDKFSVRCKVSTLISRVEDVMDVTQKVSEKHALPHSIIGHMGLGMLHIYLNSDNPDELAKAVEELRAYVLGIGSGGSLVVEAAPLSLKGRVDTWGPVRKDFFLMQAIKSRFDPRGILNPGRFIGGI